MASETLAKSVINLRPFLPAKDFDLSRRYYEALGFKTILLGDQLAHMQFGPFEGGFAFLLQDFYVKDFAENLMLHLMVHDLDAWWAHIESLSLAERFGVPRPKPPKLEPRGLRVVYLPDPAGVLWHVAQEAQADENPAGPEV